MILGRVVGTVVAEQKSEKLNGQTFLLVEKVDAATLKGKNDFLVSIDAVGAGVDEIVFCVAGSSARATNVTEGRPTDSTIVAIVDLVEINGKYTFQKS